MPRGKRKAASSPTSNHTAKTRRSRGEVEVPQESSCEQDELLTTQATEVSEAADGSSTMPRAEASALIVPQVTLTDGTTTSAADSLSSPLPYQTQDLVILDYNDLVANQDLSQLIATAFGADGVGVLAVKNVPNYVQARLRLLPLAFRFAALPDDVKAKYVHEQSYYSFGWSHGKEKLQGKPDLSKGSFYANPQYDEPVKDEEIIRAYPSFVHPNIWPKEELPELEFAFKELGQIIVHVGQLVARQCDKYVQSQAPTYPEGMLQRIIAQSLCCKARLLHYFPLTDDEQAVMGGVEQEFSSWCGWHNDHGSLTGLTAALYLNHAGEAIPCPDPHSGLYVRSRKSELIKISIPAEFIAFQIGETAQVHSGGVLQATPHAVRGCTTRGVSRATFAVFMEPMWDESMVCPSQMDPLSAQSASAAQQLPPQVPPLASRWRPASADAAPDAVQSFGQFSEATHQAYY